MSETTTAGKIPGPFDPIDMLARRDFVKLPDTAICGEAAQAIASSGADVACVVGEDDTLLGIVTLADCVRAGPAPPVRHIMRTAPSRAAPDWTAEEAAREMVEKDLAALPIVDGAGAVTGLVSALSAHRYLLDEVQEDANTFVGIVGEPEDDYMELSIWSDFRRRLPWVMGLAVAGLAAGYVVHVYEDALDALVILALYMPMVADTGGNVGTQSASLVTRAISFGDVTVRDALRIFWREARVALMMAAALFLFAYLKVLFISNPADVPAGLTLSGIGFAIAVALAVQVVSATLIGAALPVLAVSARQDPAVVSGPALTTIVDLTGLILYFGITTRMLGVGFAGGG